MIFIIFSHTANEFETILSTYKLESLLQAGWIATGVFFFLSGYGLTLSMERNIIDRAYILKHLKKLFIPYFIFWFLYIISGLIAGYFPTQENLVISFLSFKMPDTDSWFLRTILAIYLFYMLIAKYQKKYAGFIMTIMIVLYTGTLIICDVAGWWWNTICCFPAGIAFAQIPQLQRPTSWIGFILLGISVIICYKTPIIGSVAIPVLFSIICAKLSIQIRNPKQWHFPILSFIGTNSLYMYLLESIPIYFFDAKKMGFTAYIIGSIITTIALTYLGKSMENKITKTKLY